MSIPMWWSFSWDMAAANLEAQRVIGLRLMKLMQGGPAAQKEARKMVNEKVAASIESAATLARGGSPEKVLGRIRTTMRANAKRLSKSKSKPKRGRKS